MKTHPLMIAALAETIRPGSTVYPPRLGRRGISRQAWTAVEHGSEFLRIRRDRHVRLIYHSKKVLIPLSEDPCLA